MLKQMMVTFVSIAVLTLTQVSHADEEALAPAKLVVYRSEEGLQTRNLNYRVRLNNSKLGKLKYGKVIMTSVAPGRYSMDTSVRGTQTLELDLKSGQTYFIHSNVKTLGNRVSPVLKLVEEHVAVAQQPLIGSAI